MVSKDNPLGYLIYGTATSRFAGWLCSRLSELGDIGETPLRSNGEDQWYLYIHLATSMPDEARTIVAAAAHHPGNYLCSSFANGNEKAQLVHRDQGVLGVQHVARLNAEYRLRMAVARQAVA